ncbi:MAG: flagellar filament capping protein FliD [Candidatus Sericytochromatia bacterium]
MSSISFGGLASGLNTDSIIQQLISIESRPLGLLSSQRTAYQSQASAYKDLNTRLSALESKAFSLTQISSLISRKATSSKSESLLATANADAVTGAYQIEVLQLATATRLQTGTGVGQGNGQGGLVDVTTDFSNEAVSLLNSNNRLKTDITEGSFFVNGQQITVTNASTLNTILADIQTATGVTGALNFDAAKGGQVLQLSSGSPISVSTGTSNFLEAFKLDSATYSAGNLSSTDAVNGFQAGLNLDGSEGATNLSQAVGSGTLTLNGVNIAYNGASDSLNDLVQRINQSSAGVSASISNLGAGKVVLTSKSTGTQAINFSDSGNLAAALGFSAANSQVLGASAQIKVDGGAVQFFNRNSGIQADGLTGVTLDLREANPGNPFTVTITADADGAASALQGFVDQFNSVVKRINELTAYNSATKERGVLLSDFTVNNVKDRLFKLAFSTVTGLTQGSDSGSLSELGVSTGALGSTPGTTSELQFDSGKFKAALENTPSRVAQILGASETSAGTTGVMAKFKSYLDGLSNATGVFSQKEKVVNGQIERIDDRIERLTNRLATRQKMLEQQFAGMEKVLSRLQTQQSALNNLITSLQPRN